jgi:hypothetical protein
MRPKRWILLAVVAFSLAYVVWVVVSLRYEDSSLSLLTSSVRERMCWSADSNAFCVLKAMAKYEKKGRYDEAISTGVAWANKYPDGLTSNWIYEDISVLYLKSAKTDSGHAEEYLKQAVFYRDKALPSASESPYALQRLVAISESAGDLSTTQRCVQYRNSIKLLGRMNLLANEDKDRLTRQFKPDLVERKNVECLLEWIDAGLKRVSGKLSTAGCQEEHLSPARQE